MQPRQGPLSRRAPAFRAHRAPLRCRDARVKPAGASARRSTRPRSKRRPALIDDDLLAKATKLAGPLDRTAIVREGLKALIERESARRLRGWAERSPT